MIARLVAFACLLLAIGVPAAAKLRQPTGKWVADFGEAQCIAFRNYGTEEDPLYFTLKAPPMGSVIQVTVVRKGPALPPEQTNATVAFDARPAIPVSMLAFRPPESKLRSYLLNLSLSDFSAIRAANQIAIQSRGRINEAFVLSNVPELLNVMDECVKELRQDYHISDPLLVRTPESSPSNSLPRSNSDADLRGMIASEDYPWIALTNKQQGTTTFVLLINEQGRVADCSVIESSGTAVLDSQSCAVFKERARFTPAIGADGKPTKDAFVQRLSWVLK